MNETRLEKLCKAFGWQGGTIHQANKQAAVVLGMTHFNALDYTEEEFKEKLEEIEMSVIPLDW